MSIRAIISDAFDDYARPRGVVRKATRLDSGSAPIVEGSGAVALQQHFKTQEALRPLFGKGPAVPPLIGNHPDYEHLRGTDRTEYGATTTLFMDIAGSTRLGLVHDLERVFRYKNAVIRSAIDIIKSFDGHVHRIMGDAVMAFFGRRGESVESGAIDAVNCAATLRALIGDMMKVKCPELTAKDMVGIRLGVDHGPAEKVLWSVYGYHDMEEITATSYFVDVAAKLQHGAGKDKIMIGESIRALLDIPECLISCPTRISNGEAQPEPYVLPNHTDGSGKPSNYRQWLLDGDGYLRWTALGPLVAGAGPNAALAIALADDRSARNATRYQPCSKMAPKQKALRFSFELRTQPRVPFTTTFEVENHGAEAMKEENSGNHTTSIETTRVGELSLVHWEDTRYRGLHYMTIQVRSNGGSPITHRAGIWVE